MAKHRLGRFSKLTKTLAWNREVKNGNIPPNADPKDYQFHHGFPQAERKDVVPKSLLNSVGNCIPLIGADHTGLHQNYTLEELAMNNPFPKQGKLW